MNGLARLIAFGALILQLPSLADGRSGLPALPHVRAGDADAGKVLERAQACSPTVARLIAELQETDVIVLVVAGWLPGSADGITRVLTCTPTVRYLRVVLRLPNSECRLMAVLGHELQHAVEIAHLPGVRDARSLSAAYLRIGIAKEPNRHFETEAAVKAGRQVAREVSRER
jgi:hypothetical protein